MGPTAVAGKVQTAVSVSKALSCPLFQGDSLHESSSKAASLGASKPATGIEGGEPTLAGPNKARYERMWLSKMTRTGLLFPEESRVANEGFSGFGGTSSTSTSRRGSSSSIDSSVGLSDTSASLSSVASSFMSSGPPAISFINKPVFALSEEERLRKANPALMVLTHPNLQKWHKESIRRAVGEYKIGVIFVPLYEDDDLPVLKPLDPRTMMSFDSFGSFGAAQKRSGASLDEEIVLRVNVDAKVEEIIEEIIDGVRDIMRE